MTQLLDHNGKPLAPARRMRREDEDLVLGLRRPRFHGVIATGLTPQRLVSIFAEVERGRYDQFLTLAKELERHDSHYRSVLGIRKLAVLMRKPVVTAVSDDPDDVAVAEAAQAFVDSDDWLRMSLWCLDALGKGYAATEMIWDFSEGDAWPTFKQRDPRDFAPDEKTLSRLMRKIPGTSDLEEIPYGKYIIHCPSLIAGGPVDGALALTEAILYLYTTLAMHDMGDFLERFGTPTLLGEYTSDEQKQELLDGLAALARAGYGVHPRGTKVEVLDGARTGGSESLHTNVIAHLDRQKSKLVLGQTMTSEDGSSRSQAEVHERVEEMVNTFDVAQLCSAQQRQVLDVWRWLNFGDRVETPYLDRPGDDEEDIERVANVLFGMADRGARVPTRHLFDLLGVGEVDESEDVLQPKSTGKGDVPGVPGRLDAQPDPEPMEDGDPNEALPDDGNDDSQGDD